ncbi:MAG: RHS repeat-associated core domain-containing protein, partial [Halioglobus sp.]
MPRFFSACYFLLALLLASTSHAAPGNPPPVPQKPNPPGSLTLAGAMPNITGAFTVRWGSSQSSGASYYYLYRSKNGAAPALVTIGNNSNLNFNESGLAPGNYLYQISACATNNYATCSDPAARARSIVVHPQPTIPGNFRINDTAYSTSTENYGEMTFDLKWSAASNITAASVYYITRTLNGGVPVVIAGLGYQVRDFAETLTTPGTYVYSVVACVNYVGGCGNAALKTVTMQALPGAVTGAALTPAVLIEGDEPRLTWSSQPDVAGYNVSHTHAGAETVNEWVDASLAKTYAYPAVQGAGTHIYRVRACVSILGPCGGYASVSKQAILAPAAVSGLSLTGELSNGDYGLQWNVSANASGYVVAVTRNGATPPGYGIVTYIDGSNATSISAQVLTQAYTASGGTIDFTQPASYEFFLSACVNNGTRCSNASQPLLAEVEIPSDLPGPTAVTISNKDQNYTGNYTLSWSAVTGAGGYRIAAYVDSVALPGYGYLTYVSASTTTVTSEQLTTAYQGATDFSLPGLYQYLVTPCATETECSPNSGTALITVRSLLTPSGFTVEDTEVGYTLSWNPSTESDVAGYWIRSSIDGIPYDADNNPQGFITFVNSDETLITSDQLTQISAGVHDFEHPATYDFWIQACTGFLSGNCSPIHAHTLLAYSPPADGGVLPAPSPEIASAPPITDAAVVTSDKIGSTSGQFRVDDSGAATYSFPIAVPAGTAGIAPEISLNYSSLAGNGLLGKGWSIGGLSAITRCRQTLVQDNQARPITWTSQDRFCLDGQRLVLESGDGYGAAGSTYKTEIDSFAKVTAIGSSDGAPVSFEVRRKDGSLSHYGATSNSKHQTSDNNHTMTWALSQFQDSLGNFGSGKGNYIEYHYTGDHSDGHRIGEIRYAFGTGSSHNARIVFNYDNTERPDPVRGYVAGYQFATTRRLQTIEVFNGSSAVRQFHLNYGTETASRLNKLSRLRGVQECNGATCLNPTQFTWVGAEEVTGESLDYTLQGETVTMPGTPYGFGYSASPEGTTTLENRDNRLVSDVKYPDINGDGLPDIVWVEPKYELDGNVHDTKVNYAVSNGTGFGPRRTIWRDSLNHANYKVHVLDYNADGRQDVLLQRTENHNLLVFLSMATAEGWRLESFSPDSEMGAGVVDLDVKIDEELSLHLADLNSDGLVDLVYRDATVAAGAPIVRRQLAARDTDTSDNQFYAFDEAETIAFNTSTPNFLGTQNPVTTLNGRGVGADFNGDGQVDLLTNDRFDYPNRGVSLMCRIMIATEEGFDEYAQGPASPLFRQQGEGYFCAMRSIQPVDINADGLSDLLMENHAGDWFYSINTGAGFEPKVALANEGETILGVPLTVDYNQDGYPDVSWHNDQSDQLAVKLWLPEQNGFAAAFDYQATNGRAGQSRFFADMNGDGVADYLHFRESSLDIYHSKGAHHPRGMIAQITNGLGAKTRIHYGALSTSGHYARVEVSTSSSEACISEGHSYDWCSDYLLETSSEFYQALNGDWGRALPEGAQTLGKNSPILELMAPLYVVNAVSSSAPLAGNPQATSSISYFYGEAKIQAAGRGLLGFEKIRTIDAQTGLRTTTTFRQDFPFIGHSLVTRVETKEGQLLKESHNDSQAKILVMAGDNAVVYQPFISRSDESSYSTGSGYTVPPGTLSVGGLLQKVATVTSYDFYGNPLSVDVTTQDGEGANVYFESTTNTYGADIQWYKELGRLTHTRVNTHRFEGQEPSVRESTFSYFTNGAKKGLLQSETIEPNQSEYTLTTTYQYDTFGNRKKVTQVGAVASGSAGIRIAESVYDAATGGRNMALQKNSVGQTTQWVTARDALGLPTQLLDINGVATNTRYGSLGKPYFVSKDNGASSLTLMKPCDLHCPSGANRTQAAYVVHTKQAGGAESKTYYDLLEREVRRATLLFAGDWAFVDINYDNLGRVVETTEPYRSGETVYKTEISYDILGRIISTKLPGILTSVRASYLGLSTLTENPKGQRKTEVTNVLGELVDVYDDENARLSYGYDADGNLASVRHLGNSSDPHNVLVTMDYDLLGRKTIMDDPDKGHWEYEYNAFGELEIQTNGNNQTSTMNYDALGRMIRRVDRRADGSVESDSRWSFNNALTGGGRGSLIAVDDLSSYYSESYGYDSLGRPSITTTQLEEGDNHCAKTTYDQYGRVFQNFDAGGDCSWDNSATQTHYNTYGFLEKITDAVHVDGNPKDIYYEVKEMDARVNVTKARHGNGLIENRVYNPATGRLATMNSVLNPEYLGGLKLQGYAYDWDAVGNLKQRKNVTPNRNFTEDFTYDTLNRMTRSQVQGKPGREVRYNTLGNITWKSDVGSYTYDSGGTLRPHAVTYTGDGAEYQYDNNGNMKSDSTGRTFTYSTFDKPIRIVKGGHVTSFQYGPNRSRYMRIDRANSQETKTRYLRNVEKITKPDGSELIKRHLGNVVITLSVNQTDTASVTNYILKDHLGSLDVTTDKNGSERQFYEFDAWGKRRGINGLDLSASELMNFDTSTTTRGFTGHEMLDQVGVIHMNGRIYDPVLGRFLQADPFVDGVTNTQGYNRYSYVHNNLLAYTDPTGYFSFKDVVKVGAVVAIAALTYGAASAWASNAAFYAFAPAASVTQANIVSASANAAILGGVVGGASAGFAAGVATAAFNGASAGDALSSGVKGAFSGAVFGGIGGHFGDQWSYSRIATNSIAGGVTSRASGGSFADGFRLSLATSILRTGWEYTRTISTRLKLLACANSPETQTCRYEYGDVRLDGTRGRKPGTPGVDSKLGANFGMTPEGDLKIYDSVPFVSKFINRVGFTHDFQNSWRYDWDTGFFTPFQSQAAAEAFEVYSFFGMPIAA